MCDVVSELKGRGAVWTEERGARDERRGKTVPQKRPGSERENTATYRLRLTWQETDMPYMEIKLFESRVEDDEVAAQIVRAVTDGLCSVIGEAAREQTWVVVEGVSPKRWGFGGEVAKP